MQEKIEFNGTTYISLKRAAEEIDLSRDYMARLCKKNLVDARRLDSGWYVDPVSIRAYLRAQEHAREFRRKKLAEERATEYRKKSAQRIDKSVLVAPVSPAINYASEVHGRMRRALEKQHTAAFSVLSESGRMPGMIHAAGDIPARALSHVPVHVVTPAMDLIHRVTALIGACVLVFGTYSLVNPTYAHTAYDSMRSTLATALSAGESARAVARAMTGQASVALARYAETPSQVVIDLRDSLSGTYDSAIAVTSHILPSPRASTASSADAITEQTTPVLADAAPVAAPQGQLAAAGAVTSEPISPGASVTTQPIAVAVPFTGTKVAYGDLISYDPEKHIYTLSATANDEHIFGVAIQDPALLYKPDNGSNISVARSGAALLNVTLENGPIAQGDALTSSSIPGKARKAKDGEHVIATAKEAFSEGGVMLRAPDGSELVSGTISVNVGAGASATGQSAQSCTTLSCRVSSAVDPHIVRTLVRYLLSGIIAALSLILAFKSFMSDANYGVISIGRNPRAKSSIQSLVFFNAILALVIASAGLFAAMVVLFAG